jgi:hypothetical protein
MRPGNQSAEDDPQNESACSPSALVSKRSCVMETNVPKEIVLYLEDWQQRMIHDVLGETCVTWRVLVGGSPGGVKYRVGMSDSPQATRMYLTEWQVRQIKDEAREACEYVELTHSTPGKRYGVGAERI